MNPGQPTAAKTDGEKVAITLRKSPPVWQPRGGWSVGHCGPRPSGLLLQDSRESGGGRRTIGATSSSLPSISCPSPGLTAKKKKMLRQNSLLGSGKSARQGHGHCAMLSSFSLGILPTTELHGAQPGPLGHSLSQSPFCPKEMSALPRTARWGRGGADGNSSAFLILSLGADSPGPPRHPHCRLHACGWACKPFSRVGNRGQWLNLCFLICKMGTMRSSSSRGCEA